MESGGNLNRHCQSFLPGKTPPGSDLFFKRMPSHKLHRVIVLFLFLPIPQKPDDIGMPQLAQRVYFLIKTFFKVRIIRQRLRKNLDGRGLPCFPVNRSKYRPHSSAANTSRHVKRTKMFRKRRRHFLPQFVESRYGSCPISRCIFLRCFSKYISAFR